MTYYEELGVETAASREEIRQAYKQLARLIHPDQCGDEPTRRLADLQLKRLNAMVEVLLNPAGRERYDRSLAALALAVSGQAMPAVRSRWNPEWMGPAATLAAGLTLLLLLIQSPAKPPEAVIPSIPQVAGAMAAKPATPSERTKTRSVKASITTLEPEWEPLATYGYESHVAPPPLLAVEMRTTAAPGAAAAATPSPNLSGDWLFVPSGTMQNLGYPPEYIELHLRQQNDLCQGRYVARYRVADQTISPNVAFQFEGPIGPEGGTLTWRGAAGAKGEIVLHLLPSGDLEVKWEAVELGKELSLISGAATLVRKLE